MTAVRIGIVSWNTAAHLDRCLASLPAAMAGTDFDVVVVDNDSSDGSAGVVAAHPHARLLRNEVNVGYGRAMNQALAGGDAPVLIALNPDTVAPPGSLARLVAVLLADASVGLVGPRLVNEAGVTQYSARPFPSLDAAAAALLVPVRRQSGPLGRRLRLEWAPQPAAPADVDWVIGAVHVIRASALRGRAPYDERWFMYVEDIELCWWLAARGWRCRYQADVTVRHVGHAAGAQAWAAPDEYERRCFDAIYDWYQRDVSRRGVRALAALNALTAASRAVVAGVAGRPAEHEAHLRRAVGYHAGIARRGPPPPAGPPASRPGVATSGPPAG
ncbi:MAG TPA: glycosyltransferase family 2 protein [Acidimicrobiales bacterium]|jgi:GT2 family glycosyltransferase|nr:glycosyltransferase family 2 protein [Acidimicrobiales bacterium]